MYGEKLKQLRKIEGWTQEEVAKRIGVSKQTYNHYENEKRTPSLNTIRKLAKVYNVELDDIFSDKNYDSDAHGKSRNFVREEPSLYEVINNDHSNITQVPILGTIPAGEPIFADENIEGYLPVLNTFLSHGKEYFYLKVSGNSMNLEFQEGSYVLCECTPSVENGQIAAIRINSSEVTLKKVIMNKNYITLIPMSNNPSYQPTTYDLKEDHIEILGRVIQATKLY
ncbi:LexA family protein [Halalkalibacterium ligniniphilum]|uniref:LexA family protein n=1 Tax=Halalkalibacterium ligniniphilum TaxID=1134413 RepID=UPI0003453009|nr:XRE family transcriptional regulator [Halalkalibacterium ligniniphilum]